MGRWAAMAEDHWRRYLPNAYAQLTDREAFFAEIEEEAQRQVEDLEDQLTGTEPPGETMAHRLTRYRRARQMAEEVVIAEVILDPPPESDPSAAGAQGDAHRTPHGGTAVGSSDATQP